MYGLGFQSQRFVPQPRGDNKSTQKTSAGGEVEVEWLQMIYFILGNVVPTRKEEYMKETRAALTVVQTSTVVLPRTVLLNIKHSENKSKKLTPFISIELDNRN